MCFSWRFVEGVKTKNISLQPGIRNITINGICPSSQTQTLPYPLNVFAQVHHMHLLGASFKMERVRAAMSAGPYLMTQTALMRMRELVGAVPQQLLGRRDRRDEALGL